MKNSTTNITIRIDKELKKQTETLFSELGMNISTAFNVFIRQSIREGGMPFMIDKEQPNKETIAAIKEAERISNDSSKKSFTNTNDSFDELKK